MTTLREAAQQALEALEIGYDSAKAEATQYHAAMAGYRPQVHAAMDADVQKIAQAITALKAALAQQAERKPLTDEEIDAVVGPLGFAQLSPREVARAIEQAHGIGGQDE